MMARGMSAIPYDIRRSARARRLSARVHRDGRVEIVAPRLLPLWVISDFVDRHRLWIEQRVSEACARHVPQPFPPLCLELPALERRWSLTTVVTTGGDVRLLERSAETLELHHPLEADLTILAHTLREWLRDVIRQPFEQRLSTLALQHGYRYERMQLRWQRSRWGSCSRRGVISLNGCAAFQSSAVLDYLMIHELAHTRYMNHSKQYWAEVARCAANWHTLDAELRQGWQRVPAWIFRR